MSVIYRYIFILLCIFTGVPVVASDQTKVDAFLQSLFKKPKSLKKSKSSLGFSSKEDSFLRGLKQQATQAKQQEQKEALAEQQKEIEGLHYIVHFYGNPKYHAAMDILNNPTLQATYQQDINAIQMSIFDYSEEVIKKFHTSHAKDQQDQQDINSFLSSLHSTSQKPKESAKEGVTSEGQQTNQKVASFLSTLKG